MVKYALPVIGRTPHGVRGLKYDVLRLCAINTGRTPHGVRGLKFKYVWYLSSLSSRTPHGVRGLKSSISEVNQ